MKRFALILTLAALAIPAHAITTCEPDPDFCDPDCSASLGLDAENVCVRAGGCSVFYLITFYNGESFKNNISIPFETDFDDTCLELVINADSDKVGDEHRDLFEQLLGNETPELLQPEFPETCVVTCPAHPAVTVADCRRSAFHQFVFFTTWNNEGGEFTSTMGWVDYGYELADWLLKSGGQGGSGFSNSEEQCWVVGVDPVPITNGQRSDLNSRTNNTGGIVTGFRTDQNNWAGCPTFTQDGNPGVAGCQP